MAYNYQDISDRVLVNLGIEGRPAKTVSIIRKDIYDVSLAVLRKVQPVYRTLEVEIKPTDSELMMPGDFFIPREVVFYKDTNTRYASIETEYERLLNWTPQSSVEGESFNVLLIGENVNEVLFSNENLALDGYIGYTFLHSDEHPKFIWKPAKTATLKILYSAIPDEISNLLSVPQMNKVFRSILSDGVTIKHLTRKMGIPNLTDIQLYAIRAQMSEYKASYTEGIEDLNKYINRDAQTDTVDFNGIFSDPTNDMWRQNE